MSWHPFQKDKVLTSSTDGSARMWDLIRGKTQFSKLCCGSVYRAKSAKGKRVAVTCIEFAPSGMEFALGTVCGSIQIWKTEKVTTRPERVRFNAHGGNGDRAVHSLVYNMDGTRLASRSMHHSSVRVWEVKKLSKNASPIVICGGLNSLYEYSNSAFSPDGRLICAGSSVKPQSKTKGEVGSGKLKVFRVDGQEGKEIDPIFEMKVAVGISVVCGKQHNKLLNS